MLIKEYRIPMPLSVEEYRIAQLYMIQKKSREESQGEGSGVEIIENRPYENGLGGNGQYTRKIYHISKHIPGWFVAILPKDALIVYEEAWNAYPHTRTRYTCPFIDKFSIDIETKYYDDPGDQDNVFETELRRSKAVDLIDIVTDPSNDKIPKEEDPKIFRSSKTGRGPLAENWLSEAKRMKGSPGHNVMCSYKLCKVEFKYWGMQSKIEKFIHDVALRKTMGRAHRQAWCWQDEWFGLTMADIRKLERETQMELERKFGSGNDSNISDMMDAPGEDYEIPTQVPLPQVNEEEVTDVTEIKPRKSLEENQLPVGNRKKKLTRQQSSSSVWSNHSKTSNRSSLSPSIAEWRMQSIEQHSDESSDGDEFFDAIDTIEPDPVENHSALSSLVKEQWGSMDSLDDDKISESEKLDTEDHLKTSMAHQISVDEDNISQHSHPLQMSLERCKINTLFLVVHGGNPVESLAEGAFNHSTEEDDVATLSSTFEIVVATHYKTAMGRFAFRLVHCPMICQEAWNVLKSLCPMSTDGTSAPLSSALVSAYASHSPHYMEAVNATLNKCNSVFQAFLQCKEGRGFNGQVCIIADSIGGLITYDMLASTPGFKRSASQGSNKWGNSLAPHEKNSANSKTVSTPPLPPNTQLSRRSSSGMSLDNGSSSRLDFEVADVFVLGSPLGINLALRNSIYGSQEAPKRPSCSRFYNVFYMADPASSRLEPLLDIRFSKIEVADVPRYHKFPLGDGKSLGLGDVLSANIEIFLESDVTERRRGSELSVSSFNGEQLSNINQIASKWFGDQRVDYALFCPESLASFPSVSLPHLFYASFWESTDLAAFIVRQVVHQENIAVCLDCENQVISFTPSIPREKWHKRRTHVKIRNMTSNHRGRDSVAIENGEQILCGRFTYGPLDVVSLTGEKIDVYVNSMNANSHEWVYVATETTDSHGRINCSLPSDKLMPPGIFPVKMVVRGDLTIADSYLAVLPPHTDCVIFSIDGSFAASVSLMGSDPKVRPGSVDVVRYWQDLGYLIIYVTARPDMQKHRVVTWLAHHNFPHGPVWFSDGLSHDPMKQKTNLLKQLQQECKLNYAGGYGSSKDIAVYNHLGLSSDQIYIIGKASKKQVSQCMWLSDGYALHLRELKAKLKPAKYNAQIAARKGSFGLPGYRNNTKSKRSLSKKGNTLP